MIIQVRGTSGSGKSTVVRAVMQALGDWEPVYVTGRKRPLYYFLREYPGLVVLGHYESPCGGCDTIGSAAAVYELIMKLPDRDILCEGLLLSEDTKWSLRLGSDLRVIFLTTPLEDCLERIGKRRAEAGNTKALNTGNTSRRVAIIERARLKLLEAGVMCRRCSSAQAPGILLSWLHAAKGGKNGSGTIVDKR